MGLLVECEGCLVRQLVQALLASSCHIASCHSSLVQAVLCLHVCIYIIHHILYT